MGKRPVLVLFVLAMIVIVVGVDVLFFQGRIWERWR
jgi:uncharacterized membrane protein